jgi:hypothetical protein
VRLIDRDDALEFNVECNISEVWMMCLVFLVNFGDGSFG